LILKLIEVSNKRKTENKCSRNVPIQVMDQVWVLWQEYNQSKKGRRQKTLIKATNNIRRANVAARPIKGLLTEIVH
jgi:hypothetical protein